MENESTTPIFTVGTLPKKCYDDIQEFANDLAKVLTVPEDNAKVFHGAKGDKGDNGSPGLPGPPGPPSPDGVSRNVQTVEIPNGATYVDVPMFTDWQFASYHVLYNGYDDHPDDPDFDDLGVITGVGTIVPLYALPESTTIRVFFTFLGGVAVPDDNHILNITVLR